MNSPPVPEVKIPFLKKKVPLIVDLNEHPAMDLIKKWGPALKKKVEEAPAAEAKPAEEKKAE